MRAVGLKVLKNRLSEYVRLAAGGETVLVTDRDRIVAELVPPRADRRLAPREEMLADLVRKGLVSPAAVVGGGPPPGRQPVATLDVLMSELDADREDR